MLEPVNVKNMFLPVVLGREVQQFAKGCICVGNLTFLNTVELLTVSIRFQMVVCLWDLLSVHHIILCSLQRSGPSIRHIAVR